MEFHCSSFKSYEDLLDSFKNPEQRWPTYGNGAVLQFRSPKTAYILSILFYEGRFSLDYSITDRATFHDEVSLYSVGDSSTINEFILADETYVPAGSFLDNDTAKRVVESFYSNPASPPNLIQWVEESSLSWPEL